MQVNQRAIDPMQPWGIALIRVVVGLTFFMHGQQKLFDQGIDGVTQFFTMLGIPAPGLAAVVVSIVETVGGLALILGLLTRVVAVLLAIDMTVAFFVFHLPNGFFVSDGGVELVLVLGASAIGFILTGPGALAIDDALPFERRWRRAEAV